MKFLRLSALLTLLISIPSAWAIQCPWWQTQVDGSRIPRHPRGRQTVKNHPRKEHCRERWKGADTYIQQFRNDPIKGWPHKEVFKPWSRAEMEKLLRILPTLPAWAELGKYQFLRATKADTEGNPARSEVTNGAIVLYDIFFTHHDQSAIIAHESAHHLFKKLTPLDINNFVTHSGWSYEANFQTRKVFKRPPSNPIQPDSILGEDEDFANNVEEFFKAPDRLQKSRPMIYNFLKEKLK